METMIKFERLNRKIWIAFSALLVLILDIADYVTGPAFAFSLFYLVPVAMSSWFVGRWLGIAVSIASSITWLITEILSGRSYLNTSSYYWEAFTRITFYSLIALLFSALKNSLNKERVFARTDKTTGAANTRHFYELLQAELNRSIRYGRIFTIAYMDLDNFKEVNDSFGHSTGDRVLGRIVSTSKMNLRSTDIIARLGGDEFAILMPETEQEQARANLTRIQDRLLEEMRNNDWPVTFSIGVLTYREIPESVDKAIRMADDLMYSVKNSSKNAVRYAIYPE